MKHTRTDPACREYRGYREPRNPITRYLDRRARGKSCQVCMQGSWIRARWNDLPADALYCNPRADLHLNCEHVEGSIFEYNLRAALEAAAPHMLAEGYADVFDEGLAAGRGERPAANPYRPTA